MTFWWVVWCIGQSGVVGRIGDFLYVFSGENAPLIPVDGNVWKFNLTTRVWSDAPWKDAKVGPCPRVGHAGTVCQDKLYMFGGRTDDHGAMLSDFWCFDPADNSWTELSTKFGTGPGTVLW